MTNQTPERDSPFNKLNDDELSALFQRYEDACLNSGAGLSKNGTWNGFGRFSTEDRTA